MRTSRALIFLVLSWALVVSCKRGGAPSSSPGSYQFDTVTFVDSGGAPPATGTAPGIYIDTNTEVSGLLGGSVESSKPYSIALDYTDETFTFAGLEITRVGITYDDGTDDPGAAALKLPLRIAARPYEATNSVTGGRIVKTRLRVISGKIPGVISRDEPITLLVEGQLIKDDGTRIPFEIKREYDVVTDKSTKAWSDVMQDR